MVVVEEHRLVLPQLTCPTMENGFMNYNEHRSKSRYKLTHLPNTETMGRWIQKVGKLCYRFQKLSDDILSFGADGS